MPASFESESAVRKFTTARITVSKKNPLLKACRNDHSIDPILLLPATAIERSRTIRWHMGWLSGQSKDCKCNRDRTSRRHFCPYECDAIPHSLWDDLPSFPFGLHSINHALNCLSCDSEQYQEYWPNLQTLLWYIESACHQDINFPKHPAPGVKWCDHCAKHSPALES